MRKHFVLGCLTVGAMLLAAHGSTQAQHYQPFGDLNVHHDMQWFAPPIIDEYGDEPVSASYGWFAQYDRMSLWVSRPQVTGQNDGVTPLSDRSFLDDRTWGNRFDIGYMTEEDHGWHVGIWDMQNPNSFSVETVPGVIFGGANPELAALTSVTSLNSLKLKSMELNKTFRLKQTAFGLNREMFFGLRALEARQFYRRTTRTFNTLQQQDIVVPGAGNDPTLTIRQIDRRIVDVNINGDARNHMLGFQLGTRWYMDRGHWRVSAEVRAFTLYNSANMGAEGRSDTIDYRTERVIGVQPPTPGFQIPPTNTVILDRQFAVLQPGTNRSLDNFAFGGELRLEAQYQVTRDISTRVGFQLMDIGGGMIRSPVRPGGANAFQLFGKAEDLVAMGVTFGIELNR